MEPIYIKSNAVMIRQGNTLYIANAEIGKQPFPIKNVSDIYCLGKVTIRSGAADLLMKEGIPVHFLNKYGGYVGTLMPKDDLISGKVIIAQASHHIDYRKRMVVAKKMLQAVRDAMIRSLKYYKRKGKDVARHIDAVSSVDIVGSTISELMGAEGQAWIAYYESYNTLNRVFPFTGRQYHPPTDPLNSLISLANSLLYATVVSEIRRTYLHPAISFVHEPLERRFSLALDLADIFKPLITTRVVLRLINTKQISPDDFDTSIGFRLSDSALEKFITAYNSRITETIRHPTLKRRTSYRYLIRLECYKLVKHFLGDKEYQPLTIG